MRAPALCYLIYCLAALNTCSPSLTPDANSLHGDGSGEANKRAVRVALLTDTHVTGPQYVLGSESNPLDNISVVKTQQRLWQAFSKLKAVRPAPEMVLITGDFIHDGYYSLHWETLTHGAANNYKLVASMLFDLGIPVAVAFGNHDYKVVCKKKRSVPQHFTEKLYSHFFGAEPYKAYNLGAYKLLVLNSQLGHTWQSGHHACNTRWSSYGRHQLEWAASHLAEGLPTVVAMHHPLPTSARNEEPDCHWPDILTLLSSFPNVKLVLSGHYHKGYSWGSLYPFEHRSLPALRYSENNFFLLDLFPNGTFNMPDWKKNKGGSRCSYAWQYDGEPEPCAQETQDDCGVPLAEDTDTYQLPPITSLADIPPDFNPELACSFALAKQMLAPCLEGRNRQATGPSDSCCEILTTEFQHGSARSHDGCLCKPDFWEETEAAFAAEGLSLSAVMDTCAKHAPPHVPLFYRGVGACPAAPSSAASAAGSGTALGQPVGEQTAAATQ